MAAYLIADVNVTDPAVYERYRQGVPATIAAYGGRYLARGGRTEVLEGDWQPHRVVILEFPSMARLQEWYRSPDYAPLTALRQASASSTVVITEGL